MFIHLHNHFMIDSSMKIKDVVAKAVADKQPAIAITDHNNVALHIQFYNECVANNIKPILGCEFYFVDDAANPNNPENTERAHLLVFAKNKEGLANLYNLISEGKSKYYVREKLSLIDWELLTKYKEGLMVTNACIFGTVASKIMKKKDYYSYAKKFVDLFDDDFYFEIGYHYFPDQRFANRKIIELAERFNKTAMLVNDCHFTEQEDWYIHDIVFIKSFQFRDKSVSSESQESYFKTEKEMEELGYDRKHLDETIKFADKIETINPLDVIGETSENNSFCLTSNIYKVKPIEAIEWASEKFNVPNETVEDIVKEVNDNETLETQYQNSKNLKTFLDENEMVKEAVFKLEGIQINIFPDDKNIVYKTNNFPTANYIDKFDFSLFPYSDLKENFKIESIDTIPEYKEKVDKAFIFGKALDYYNNDIFKKAISNFEKLEDDDEYGYDAKFYIANAYFFNNKYDKAIRYYRFLEGKILSDEKKYWVYYFYAVCTDKYKRNRDKAIELFENAIEIDKNKSNAYYALGITLFFARKHDKALKNFEKFLELASNKDINKIPKVKDFIKRINKQKNYNNNYKKN